MDYKGEWGGGGPGHSWAFGPRSVQGIFFSPLSFVAVLDPGSGMAKNQDPGSGIKNPGSATLV